MNELYLTGTSTPQDQESSGARTRFLRGRFALLLWSTALCLELAGCGFLKPAQSTASYYVLTPIPVGQPAGAATSSIALGVGRVNIPSYLFNASLVVRKGDNEIEYSESALWAERLNVGFQRVLAANLATLLSTDRVQLSAWDPDSVTAEIYVTIDQFDVDISGRGVLVARWRVLSPRGEKVLKAGTARLSRQGPASDVDGAAAVATLSELLAEFSRQVAQAIPR
jgi:uncharacterized lipoprotein YmbA